MHLPTQLALKGRKASLYSLSGLLAFTSVFIALQSSVSAGALTSVTVRFDRMKISQATTGTVCAKTATVGAETQVVVTFPTGYTLGLPATFTTSTTNLSWPTGANPWPTIQASATSVVGQVVTFTSGDLTASTLYCFNWTNSAAVQIKSSATSSNSGTVATNLDSASFSTASLTEDSIAVSASVPQAFSFALSATTTDALGTLSSGSVAVSPTPRTATVNTNAGAGWYVWAKDTGLTSPSTSNTIPTGTAGTPGVNGTLSAGSEGYNTGVTSSQTSGTGTITVATPYVGGVTGKGGGLDTTLRTLASSNGTANGAVLTLTNNAAISATTTAAADYADTITVVGAGMF